MGFCSNLFNKYCIALLAVLKRQMRVPLNSDTDTKAILCLKFPLGSRVLKDFSSPKNSFLKSPVVAYHEILQRALCENSFVHPHRQNAFQCLCESRVFSLRSAREFSNFQSHSDRRNFQSNIKVSWSSKQHERATPVKVSAVFQLHLERHKSAFITISTFPARLVACTFKNLF